MYMPFQIVIPSYKRARTLRDKTLAFLKEQGVYSYKITIFVADEEEKRVYEEVLDPETYGAIVVGVPGLANQRNFISQYYPENEWLCQMDDDVKGIKCLGDTFDTLVWKLYVRMTVDDIGLAGVLPNDDGRRMKNDATTHLTHIIGSFFVCRNRKDFVLYHDEKEDMVRSIWYFKKDGKVLRVQNAGVMTTYNKGSGGLICPERPLKMEEGMKYILETYPEYCRAVQKKKGRDIVLNWRATS
jgi:hypothetical protein